MPDVRSGFLCMNDWAGYREKPVTIVGETRTRYRISTDTTIVLPGRRRYLEPGGTALVPKTAVKLKDQEKK